MDSITGVDSIQYHGVIIRASVDELGKSCEPGVAPSESRTEPGPSRTGDSVYAAGWKEGRAAVGRRYPRVERRISV